MVTASVDKTARIWDAEAGAQIAVLLGPLCPIFKGFLRLPTFIPAKPCPSANSGANFRRPKISATHNARRVASVSSSAAEKCV